MLIKLLYVGKTCLKSMKQHFIYLFKSFLYFMGKYKDCLVHTR